MYKLIQFIRSVYVVLLFVVIEVAAIYYYAHSSYYTQARMLTRSNQIVGCVHGAFSGVKHYFTLGRENRLLTARIGELESRLALYRDAQTAQRLDSYMTDTTKREYGLQMACIVSNSINKKSNFLVINKGLRDGVTSDMAVLSASGAMAGYIVDISDRYAIAMSILNVSFRASGKIANSEYFGSIYWDGTDTRYVTMDELSKYSDPKIGDEVVTTGFSQYFPSDILIGTIESFSLNGSRTSYTLQIRLATEVSGLGDVILVRNQELPEVRALEQSPKVMELTSE